jgi:PAS domain S-box-containing protein
MSEEIEYYDIFQCTSYGIVVTDANGLIRHVNDKSLPILRVDVRQCIGQDIANILPLIGRSAHQCLATGRDVPGHQILGQRARLFLNVNPIIRNGRTIGAICSFQELSIVETWAKKLDSYKTLNRQLETIFEASSDGIWVCDGQGVVISINRASEVLNGINRMDVIGRNIADLVERKAFDQSVTAEVMATGRRQTVMQHVAKTDRHLLVTGTPSIDSSGNIALIVVNERDMTELNNLREQFEESRKIGEKYRDELSEMALMELKRNEIVAESNPMRHVLQTAMKLAHIGASNILILGESGVGKGLLAKLIHQSSPRQQNPFVEINCAALPENLLEAELFGYEKGAFTGASEKGKVGLFEVAQGGTLFLDEIGDMPLALQAKLLKYLDDRNIRRIGGTQSIRIDCATIAATNRNLPALVQARQFREDLYYRLKSFILEIPPLRERPEDIAGLVRASLQAFNHKYGLSRTIDSRTVQMLMRYAFPGNVRELRNILENAVVLSNSDQIDVFITSSLADGQGGQPFSRKDPDRQGRGLMQQLESAEKSILLETALACRTTREMAAALGISQPSVVRKLRHHGISLQLIRK